MILDSQVYCFAPADFPAGHASSTEHLRWVQAAHAGHHQPAWCLRDLEYTPHRLIGEMDYARVDIALLHTDPMLGRDSADLGECVRLYPDRLRAMAPVDKWRIRTQPDQVIEELGWLMGKTAAGLLGL